MRIWTIQNEAASNFLTERGYLEARQQHQSDGWVEAYDWIRDQLVTRVGIPPSADSAPLWGFYQWQGTARKRPDLRVVRHYWRPPGRYALIECELPDDAVMLSDMEAWNVILNDGYVSVNQEDDEAFERERKDASHRAHGHKLQERLRDSWARIIDLETLVEPHWHDMDKKMVQCCFWRLEMNQVRSIKPFNAVANRRR